MKYADLFAGIGGFRYALDDLGMECVLTSEKDKIPLSMYKDLHGDKGVFINNVEDITLEDLPEHDLIVAGIPCFPAGQRVITKQGFKNIEDIEKGDLALTHKGRYRKVVTPMVNKYSGKMYNIVMKYYKIPIDVTPEHPFYTDNGWVEARNLTRDSFVGFPINNNSIVPDQISYTKKVNKFSSIEKTTNLPMDDVRFWEVVGFWLAEGWTVDKRKRKQGYRNAYKLVMSSSETKEEYILDLLNGLDIKYSLTKERTCNKIHIVNQELWLFIKKFTKGKTASDKIVPEFIQDLPTHLLKGFVKGYFKGDGNYSSKGVRFTSTSLSVLESLQRILLKTDGRLYSLAQSHESGEKFIEERLVKTKPCYTLSGGLTQGGSVKFEDGYVFFKVDKINYTEVEDVDVYNFEVEDDNSYSLPLISVHNCQGFSQNGKKTGFKHESGSMFFEMLRVAKLKKTKYVLIENVFGILTNDNKNTITTILSALTENGYSVDFDLLTSYNFSVPQDRKRVFIIGVLDGEQEEWVKNENKTVNKIKNIIIGKNPDIKTFNFPYPKGKDKNTLISNILDKDVSKSEYLEFNEGFLTSLGNNNFRIKDGTKKGYTDFEAIPFSTTIDYKFQTSKTRRGRVKKGISKTLDQAMEVAVYDGQGFRRLTQLEVFRLQGFPDEAYYTLKNNGYRDSQMYARPSRSITIPLVKEIGKALLEYDNSLKGG